jgi:hypothetical protein
MEKVDFCGLKVDMPLHPTLEQVVHTLEERAPKLWRQVYQKAIHAPAGYNSWKLPAVGICVAKLSSQFRKETEPAINGIVLASTVLLKHDFPVYYVTRPMLDALVNTHPPTLLWDEIPLPFPGVTFMLPDGVLREPVTGDNINFLSLSRVPEKAMTAPGGKGKYDDNGADRMVIWYATRNGTLLQSVIFPVTQKLEPAAKWIEEATDYYLQETKQEIVGRLTAEFLSFLCAVTANILMVMTARPELVQESNPKATRVHPKSKVRLMEPLWIGQKYRHYVEQKATAKKSFFTELRWRAGHWRLQHYSEGRKLNKVIWIAPYLCLGGGLVREEEEAS